MNKPTPAPSSLGRRNFLKSSAGVLACAFAGTPLILRSEILGHRRAGPNSRINLGMIGCGGMLNYHLRSFLGREDVEILALCDVNRRHLSSTQERCRGVFDSCKLYEDFEEVMSRPDIDAVLVTTPDHWHAAIAIAAMRAGKDVYVEKPMTLTIREGQKMVEAERRYGRVLQVGSQQRSEWAFRRAVEIVRNHQIGEIREIYARLDRFEPPALLPEEEIPEELNYDKWLGPAPWAPYNSERVRGHYGGGWRRFWEYGSRKNGDWGAHHYDIIQWALDMDDSGPTLFVPKGYEGEPYQYHQYANGIKVYRDHHYRDDYMIRFVGTEGEVLVSRGGEIETTPGYLARASLAPGDEHVYISDSHKNNWLDCIRNRSKTICPATIGHRTATICQLAGIAERLNIPVRWNPENQEFVDSPAAERWIDRPRRAGYALPV